MSLTDFNGTWKSAGNENLDAYLEAAGCPKVYFDSVKCCTLTYDFSQDGDVITCMTCSTALGSDDRAVTIDTFKFGQEFEMAEPNGQKRKAIITFVDGKMTISYADFDGKGTKSTIVKEVINGVKLTETVTLGSVTAKVFYTK